MSEIYLQLPAILLSLSLAVYLLLKQRSRLAACALAGALLTCAVVEVFDLLMVVSSGNLMVLKKGSLIAESWQPFWFLLFALTFARDRALRGLSWLSRILLVATLALPVFAVAASTERWFYSPDFSDERILFLVNHGYYFYIALMGGMVVALSHLERTLVALPRFDRLRIKLEMVGAGTIVVMLVIYYSQAFFYRSLDMNLVPVRSLVLALAVILIGVSRLRGGVVAGVRLSPSMAYRSLVLLGVSIYLVGLGLLGEGMRYLDVGMQRAIFLSIAVLGGLGVVLVFLSEKLRRRAKVLVHKHFYQHKYDYRKEWRRFTGHLSSACTIEDLQQGILSFYCDTFVCGVAALCLRDDDRGCYRFTAGYQIQTPRKVFENGSPFVSFLSGREWVFNIVDDNPEDPGEIVPFCKEHGFSLAVPLLFEESLEGFIFLGHPVNPDERLIYEDFDLMKMLARQATSTLLSLRLSAQLILAREMAAIGRVSAFVVHDLKNLASNLSMVTENARDFLQDPEFQEDMLQTLDGTAARMKDLIARLKNVAEHKDLNMGEADLFRVAEAAVRLAGEDQVTLCGGSVPVLLDSQEMEKVVQNLVLNAREAGGSSVLVEVGCDQTPFVRVSDQGCGMSEAFIRQRLFRPFQTTKAKGFGIGLYQCRNIVEAHGGRIEVESRVGEGSCFTVVLPGSKSVMSDE